ncbi:MAG TPA: Stp1/IreP family PP2C-type Ser/Thr phosphatase [Trueperaceae bacterium]|nr:Stp1/IreP family PP2C-type Ser/Thr phosphatase [Trueperaceae bacterium]
MAARSSAAPGPETRILGAGRSEEGRVRAVNQDSFYIGRISGAGYLAVVADGMGGHRAGEIASRKAVEVLQRELERSRLLPPVALARAAQVANFEVYDYAVDHPEVHGMGTTLTAVYLDDQVGLVGHVGDSRAYLIRDGTIQQLTKDHSWVADRVRQGLLTADEARHHRWRNVITNALGATASFRLDVLHFEVKPGDRLLLCSDGVSMLLSEKMMTEIVASSPPEEATARLVSEANDRGAPDNVTAVVVQVRQVEARPKRYALPARAEGPESVDISDTMSGIRKIEDEYPANGPLSKLRKHPWYPYRIWILGSLYLLLLFLLFSLWRG